MNLDEAIRYYSRLADECRRKANIERNDYMDLKDLAAEHGQLADWLNELKVLGEKIQILLEKNRWIPVTERTPEEKDARILKKLGTDKRSDYVLATVEVKGERMTVTACTHDGKWDWNMKYAFPDYKVLAWRPLPEPYQEDKA